MLCVQSSSTNDGEMRLTPISTIGMGFDEARMLVQNSIALSEPRLPEDVRRTGVSETKDSPYMLTVVQMFVPDDSRDQLFVSTCAHKRVEPVLSRLAGVGDIQVLGARLRRARLARP